VDFLPTTHLWAVDEADFVASPSRCIGRRVTKLGRQSSVALVGAIALILVSPTIEAKIFPPAGVAYVAPPPGYNLNIRSGPGTHYPAVNTLRRGTPITITGHYEHGWAQLADRSWVAGNLINSQQPVGGGGGHRPGVPSTAYIIGPNNVNIRTGPGIQYPVVITLPPGATVRVTGFYEHGWAQLDDRSWVASNLIRIGAPIVDDGILRVGSRSPRVVQVEIRLQELRYVTPEFIPDDYFGTDTEQAVRNFQLWNGLPQTGTVDQATNDRLFSTDAVPNPYQPPAPTYKELRLGMRDPDVRRLESRLQDLDYFRGLIPDDLFDQNTEEAVRNFQRRNGLPVNGVATVRTQEVLFSSDAIRNEAPVPPPVERPTFRLGDRDPEIRNLEIRLQDLNYLRGVVADSLFDTATETAFRNFQPRNGLPVNGVADPTTQDVLYSDAAIPNEDDGTNPTDPTDPPEPGEGQATVRTNDGSDAIAFTGPGLEFDLAGFVPNGTVVTLSGTVENNWYELDSGDWLEGSFLVF
jgi:peptidoglycan hydrolase-like protein with peptidoglycan-binding domain/SH3-like domain-containing protein